MAENLPPELPTIALPTARQRSLRHSRTIELLQAGMRELAESERWQRFLVAQAVFHEYSYRNALLIIRQCPEATRVAGFHAWRRLGRRVRRGERAIWILAPRRPRGERSGTPTGFISVPVFDLSQTEGEPLPEICSRLDGQSVGPIYNPLAVVAYSIGFSVVRKELAGGVNGECDFTRRVITLESRNSDAQQVKSLAHELVHAILHEGTGDRQLAELEAESGAYILCRALGIDSGAYSFGYLATWAGDPEGALLAIEGSCVRIAHAVDEILRLLPAIEGITAGVVGAHEALTDSIALSATALPLRWRRFHHGAAKLPLRG